MEERNTEEESPTPPPSERIVRHILVIGFHHKHGYQVDYCYPPLNSSSPVFSTPSHPISLPSCWKTLPLLCLPDGSHNYTSDTIYFTMPDHGEGKEDGVQETEQGIRTIFGTACYRQIQADKLLNRTQDMTRLTVQKSVCVLSTKPLFGLIRSKLEMITHAYFEELDFSQVKILKLTYENLNNLMARDSVKENATFLGLSTRQLVSRFGPNVLVLFKAMLLEKKILFYKSPVRELCSTIMSMCSLFAGLLECGGLDYSTCDLKLSPSLLEALKLLPQKLDQKQDTANCDSNNQQQQFRDDKVFFSPSNEEVVIIKDKTLSSDDQKEEEEKKVEEEQSASNNLKQSDPSDNSETKETDYEFIMEDETMADGSAVTDPHALKLSRMKPEDCGLPLQIFTRGSFCLPYLSISYLDLIADTRVRSFVIGATNFLFKQRREMYDVIVDMEEDTISFSDPNLKRLLTPTTEDLRFTNYLIKYVLAETSKPKDEFDLISQDITKWVGGDEWVRYHFKLYTLYLLKASRSQNQQDCDPFNGNFVQCWKQSTNNYRTWLATAKSSCLDNLQSKHPFSSEGNSKGLNFSDMKLKLSYTVNNSEKGRMINQTLNGIGKWSIWNNIASTAVAASTAMASAASTATSTVVSSATSTSSAVVETTQSLSSKLGTKASQDASEQKRN